MWVFPTNTLDRICWLSQQHSYMHLSDSKRKRKNGEGRRVRENSNNYSQKEVISEQMLCSHSAPKIWLQALCSNRSQRGKLLTCYALLSQSAKSLTSHKALYFRGGVGWRKCNRWAHNRPMHLKVKGIIITDDIYTGYTNFAIEGQCASINYGHGR